MKNKEKLTIDTDVVSRIPAGGILLLCLMLSIAAFVVHGPIAMAVLTVADILLMTILSRRPFYFLWREGRAFLFQTALIVTLYLIRYGFEGIYSGLRVSWQIFLAFLPGIILMSCVPSTRLIHVLSRIMPVRLAFVLSVSLNFIPLMIEEFRSMYEVQVLRGARITPRELIFPWNWPDLVICLLVPVIVKTLSVSREIAMAAQIRHFGTGNQRTCWPYE